jgi:hypothetical protein
MSADDDEGPGLDLKSSGQERIEVMSRVAEKRVAAACTSLERLFFLIPEQQRPGVLRIVNTLVLAEAESVRLSCRKLLVEMVRGQRSAGLSSAPVLLLAPKSAPPCLREDDGVST